MSNESKTLQDGYIELRKQANHLEFIPSEERSAEQNYHAALSTVRKLLAQYGVTEAGLETAINYVEDLIMPVIGHLPTYTQLKISGSELENVFQLLPSTGDANVSIELVESLYKELERYAAGAPVAWRHDSSPEDVALGLVVLREVMHHGGFRAVSLLEEAD